MAKPENEEHYPEKQTWSTLEELLLACAVHRYGIDSWDSVSVEIQKHNSALRTLTASDCRHKYHDLKRRFSWKLASSGSVEGETGDEISDVPWLEELRKLRVDELRQEVERYDLSISSLQLKVKRLEEEREKSIKETDTETENSDLDKMVETMKESHREPENNLGKPLAKPPNQSVESNSPDPKDNSPGTRSENANRDVKIGEPVDEKPNRSSDGDGDGEDTKPVREDSCRGSCESVAKESAENSDRVDPVRRERNDSPEFIESMAESKGEEEAKETSDVQSSASLPRKETVEQDEPDNEDQSPTVKWIHVESQPLIDFIEILHSNPIGSHFSRRLESQETTEYDKIIRQHIDTEMIRNRIEAGYYKSSTRNFLRDLLLLINNARVFYGERSSEFKSLEQLNQLVKKQLTFKIPKPKEESLVTTKEVTVSSPTLSLKPKMSVPIIACRKRSSLAVRSSMSGTESHKKKMRIIPIVDVKQVTKKEEEEKEEADEEEEDEISDKDDELLISKKNTRSSRTSSTAKKVANRNVKNRDSSSNPGQSSKVRSSNDSSESKKAQQEKKGNTNISSKRQSAVSFLKRMKGASSSKTVVETTKSNSATDSKRGTEQKKNNSKNDKIDTGKPPATQKRATGKKPTNDKGSPAKKNTSIATKRGAAASSSPMVGKKVKEASEKEAASSARPKKRSRR